jgi:hypothetical protein
MQFQSKSIESNPPPTPLSEPAARNMTKFLIKSVFVKRNMTLRAAPPDVKTSGSVVREAH